METDSKAFRAHILDWYSQHRRDLPWRGDPDPYHILVSEVMLQQTGVERVRQKYHDFLERFPTIQALATASTAEVLRAWQGIGYNRRAVNLKRAAEAVVADHYGRVPESTDDLEKLPGIGKYTSRAVACFAFGAHVAVVDVNVRRVLSTFAGRPLTEKETWKLAQDLLPEGRAAEWNQALMDYGSLVEKASPRRHSALPSFRTTNRFWRGRILDILRQHDALSFTDLLSRLPTEGKNVERIEELVRTMQHEGLMTYDADRSVVSLPA